MSEYRIPMRGHTDYTVFGERLASTSSRDGEGDERWVEIEVYRLDNGRWLIHRRQVSRVYHRLGNVTCVRRNGKPMGTVTLADAMPTGDRLASCDVCEPPWPDEFETGDEVLFEFPRDSMRTENDPASVVYNLKTIRNRDGGAGFRVMESRPADDIIGQLAKHDPVFRRVAEELVSTIGKD